MTLTQVLLDEADATYTVVERLVRRVANDELSWKPERRSRLDDHGPVADALGELRLRQGCSGLRQGRVATGGAVREPRNPLFPPAALPTVLSVQEALDLLAEDRRVSLSCITAAGEANLLARRMTAPWGGPELSLFQQLLEMLKHLAQHKGQLFYYLKLMGKTVDSRDLWGGGAVEQGDEADER